MFDLFAVVAVAILTTIVALKVMYPIAISINLVDSPGKRKRHDGQVPLIGGIGIFLIVLPFMVWFNASAEQLILSACLAAIATLGAVDDLRVVRARYRLAIQLVVAAILVEFAGIRLWDLGGLASADGFLLSGWKGFAFSMFSLIGVLNVVNMSDGVDGLAGSLVAVSLAFIILLTIGTVQFHTMAIICLVAVGAMIGFLCYNLKLFGSNYRIFLGDAGSTTLGVMLAAILIRISQGEAAVMQPVIAGWILGVPLLDGAAVMARRILNNRSPFAAGRDHIHHYLLDSGLSARQTLLVLITAQMLLASIGLLFMAYDTPSYIPFLLFIGMAIVHTVYSPVLFSRLGIDVEANLPSRVFGRRAKLKRKSASIPDSRPASGAEQNYSRDNINSDIYSRASKMPSTRRNQNSNNTKIALAEKQD